tara:strand:+ start:130 stop:459 length:330 start_codon:yes stop_codon:yes gene_type:complete
MDLSDKALPPMENGEVIFEAPWQSRAFGMARTMCEKGLFDWDEFRESLIMEIEKAELVMSQPDEQYNYFDYFLAAMVSLLNEKGYCLAPELRGREAVLANRPHGHDHNY